MAPKIPAALSGAFAASTTAAGIIGQQVAGKAIRDALFLSSFHVRSLPLVMAAGAALSLLAVLWVSRLLARAGPRRVLYGLFVLGTVSLVIEWALIFVSPAAAAVAVYLHVAAISPVALSAFWSLINEQFDPHAAKAAVSRIATGGAVGGIVGGIGAWRAAYLMNVSTSVLALAAVNVFCLAGVIAIPRAVERKTGDESATGEEVKEPLKLVWKDSYLRHLALLVALGSAMSSLLDYVFSAQVTFVTATGRRSSPSSGCSGSSSASCRCCFSPPWGACRWRGSASR